MSLSQKKIKIEVMLLNVAVFDMNGAYAYISKKNSLDMGTVLIWYQA